MHTTLQKGQGKMDKKWNQIINNMEEAENGYQLDLAAFESALLLNILASNTEAFP
jgi:hypothetical protein